MPILDNNTEQLAPAMPRRLAFGALLIPAMLALASNNLGIAVTPGVIVVDDHAWQYNGEDDLSCNDGNTLSASSEVYTDVIAYWNTDVGIGQVIAVDGSEALTATGATPPTDAEVAAALPSSAYPWIRLGRVLYTRDSGTVIALAEVDHGVRPCEVQTAPKAVGLASASHSPDPVGDGALYEYAGEIAFEVDAADIAAADVVTDVPLPLFHGKIGRFRAVCTKAVTTGAKAADLDVHIGATPVTGGQVALAGAYALGAVEAGAAITAANKFKPGDVLSIVGSAVTTFVEGRFKLTVEVYRLVTI